MIRKSWIASVFLAALMLSPMMANGGSLPAKTVSVTLTVASFAEWDAANTYSIVTADFGGSISSMTATKTANRDLKLYTNMNVNITSAAVSNSGILTGVTNTSSKLTTQYELTANSDANDWLTVQAPGTTGLTDPATFFGRTYLLDTTSGKGSYTMRLTVTATPGSAAPAAENHTAQLSLTIGW